MSDPNQVVITRNEEGKAYLPHKIIKGKRKDAVYLCPVVDFSSDEAWAREMKWASREVVANVLQIFYKRVHQDLWFGNMQPDGTVNLDKFREEAQNFTQTGLKISEIEAKLDEAVGEQTELSAELMPDEEGRVDLKVVARIKELGKYVNVLKAMIVDRRKNRATPEAETEEMAPAVPVK